MGRWEAHPEKHQKCRKINKILTLIDPNECPKFSQDIKILGWCPVARVLPRGEKVPL